MGYSGVEERVTPTRTEIIILATRTQNVLGEKGRRIRELTAVVQKRFGFPEGSVELYAEKVATRGLCAIAQAESLRYKLWEVWLCVGPAMCSEVHHGEWCQGLRGGGLWQAERTESQVHEVCGRPDDPQWRPRQLLRRHSCPPRLAQAGGAGYQGEDHAAMGLQR